MRRDFEGGVYWDEFTETCGDISQAAGFRGAMRSQGNTKLYSNMQTTMIPAYEHLSL